MDKPTPTPTPRPRPKTPYTAGERTPGGSVRASFVRTSEPVLKGLEEVRKSIEELEKMLREMGALSQAGDVEGFTDLSEEKTR